jgi:hypothetical protein
MGTSTQSGTRRWLVRCAGAAAGATAGAGAIAALERDGSSQAASSSADADILNAFLLLERVQAAFYRAALATGRLQGDLRSFAATVAPQERAHVAALERRLGARAGKPPRTTFEAVLATPRRFRETAVELEEATIGVYIGEGPNLSQATMAFAAPLVSVEARQAAWIRDLTDVLPAPRAADPARANSAALADLRRLGVLR